MSEKPPTEEELVKVDWALTTVTQNEDDMRFVMRTGIYDQREERFLDTKIKTLLDLDPDEPLRRLS